MVVERGSDTTFDLLVPIDLDKISFLDWFSLMYKNTTLKLLLDVDATYMFGLIDFTANESINIPWSPPLQNLSDNTTVQAGITGLYTLLHISQNGSIPSVSDIISLFSLPQVTYTAKNGFVFSLNISSYSETVKNLACHLIIPFLVMDGGLEFTISILIGIEQGEPIFIIQEAGIEYVS
jgi:hypothetical protein